MARSDTRRAAVARRAEDIEVPGWAWSLLPAFHDTNTVLVPTLG
jgi:hypothetical protein